MNTSVIVVAAGSGERLGASRPKAFVDVGGKTLLDHALVALNALNDALHVVVVAPEAWVGAAEDLGRRVLDSRHRLDVVPGGLTRSESVRCGLAAIDSISEVVLIHDAARAFCPTAVFTRVIDAVRGGQSAVVPVLDVVDTVSPRDLATGHTQSALDRSELVLVQTPQGFASDVIQAAHEAATDDATDDAEIVRRAGHTVASVPGDPHAFKITVPADLARAQALVGGAPDLLTGIGVDVHAFDTAAPLWLGGVEWPGEVGLSGHSDGDVVLHAICDALLQAASLGDMGGLFGEARPEFKGANSRVFLTHVLDTLEQAGFQPQSVSCQLVANSPKFAPRREEISSLLSTLVGAPVHVAATTSDGLGMTGRGEGMAAFAVALVARRRLENPASK